MADETPQHRSLSQISHLFLSSVRERQTDGAPRPVRQAPKAPVSDPPPTAAQLRQAFPHQAVEQEPSMPTPPVRVVVASHLGGAQLSSLQDYASTLAASGKRVGLVVIDACQFRLMTFELSAGPTAPHDAQEVHSSVFDPRAMRDAINELSCDLDCWLLAIANPRLSEGRALMRQLPHWTVLCPADHEGIVGCYRMLKGLAELHPSPLGVSLAVVQPPDHVFARQIFDKVSGVCQQFLNWKLQSETPVQPPANVAQCTVLSCQTEHDKAQLAAAPQWQVIADLVQRASHAAAEAAFQTTPQEQAALCDQQSSPEESAAPASYQMPQPMPAPHYSPFKAHPPAAEIPPVNLNWPGTEPSDIQQPLQVVDLADETNPDSLLDAVMKHTMGQLVACPLHPPMCPQARLAVGRDRRLILVALADSGLPELRSIALAYRWMAENLQLLAMALPQFTIDSQQPPLLRLLVEQSDMAAQVLTPLFQANTVTIDSYRRVRWGQRTGVLLQAA